MREKEKNSDLNTTEDVGLSQAGRSDYNSSTGKDPDGFYVLPYDEDDIAESEKSNVQDSGERPNAFRLFLKVVFTPVEGWKAMRRSKITADEMARGCFYPVLAVLALSCFMQLVYVPDIALSDVLMTALMQFLGYFLGYFVILLFCQTLLPADCRKPFTGDFGKVFIMTALVCLASFTISRMVLPMFDPILILLSLYVIYLIFRGVKFLRAPERYNTLLIVVLSLLTIGVPALIIWVFSLMLPGGQAA